MANREPEVRETLRKQSRSKGLINGEFYFFVVLSVLLGLFVYYDKGPDTFFYSLHISFNVLGVMFPLLIGSVLFAGYAEAMLPRRLVARWLGAESGLRGVCIAVIVGVLTPGGPFTTFGLLIGIARTGAGFVTCVTYLTAWSVLGLHRLFVWEIPLLGVHIALLRYVCSLPLPFIAAFLSHLLVRRLGHDPNTKHLQ